MAEESRVHAYKPSYQIRVAYKLVKESNVVWTKDFPLEFPRLSDFHLGRLSTFEISTNDQSKKLKFERKNNM